MSSEDRMTPATLLVKGIIGPPGPPPGPPPRNGRRSACFSISTGRLISMQSNASSCETLRLHLTCGCNRCAQTTGARRMIRVHWRLSALLAVLAHVAPGPTAQIVFERTALLEELQTAATLVALLWRLYL